MPRIVFRGLVHSVIQGGKGATGGATSGWNEGSSIPSIEVPHFQQTRQVSSIFSVHLRHVHIANPHLDLDGRAPLQAFVSDSTSRITPLGDPVQRVEIQNAGPRKRIGVGCIHGPLPALASLDLRLLRVVTG